MSDERRRELERRAKQGDPEALKRWALEQCRTGGEHVVDETTQRHFNRSRELMCEEGSNVEVVRAVCSACGRLVKEVTRGRARLDQIAGRVPALTGVYRAPPPEAMHGAEVQEDHRTPEQRDAEAGIP